jgi:hypothetical protein
MSVFPSWMTPSRTRESTLSNPSVSTEEISASSISGLALVRPKAEKMWISSFEYPRAGA